MGEVYPLRASGEWAGTWCIVKKCPQYARFVVQPYGRIDGKTGVCGTHLPPAIRTVQIKYGVPAIVQEVPGPRRSESIVEDGEMRDVSPVDRRGMQAGGR